MTDNPSHLTEPDLRWPLRLTLAGLWAERLTRAFWPLWTVLIATLAALGFGVQDRLPLEGIWAGLGLAGLAALWALIIGLRGFAWPRRAEALARLDAALPGRPLAALADTQVIGAADRASVVVWQAHRARMAARAATARAVPPDLRLARRDPFALRYLALTALVMALLFGAFGRVASVTGLAPGGGPALAAGPTWEGWAAPPAHTGHPALYLADITAPELALPLGSHIQIRLYGTAGALSVAESVSARKAPPPASETVQDFDVQQSGSIAVTGPGGREWRIIALPDAPPSIATSGEASRARDGSMTLPFSASDDYGVTGGQASIALNLAAVDRRYGLTTPPEPRAPITLDLPLPITGSRADFTEVLTEDLSKHPFANLPVTITLSARDALGQTGQTPPISITLPGKRFFDPLAAALIELRRDLLWSRANARRVAQILKAVTNRPEDLIRDQRAYLRLRVALRRLDADAATLTPAARDELAEALWEIAVLVEEGDLASAQERLRRAQDRLDQAIRNGADPGEVDQLMRDLREALDDYMRQLAEQAQRNPDSQTSQNQQGLEMTTDQLQQMLDELQKLMQEGRTAEAAQLLEMLRQLMENMQVTQGPGGSGGPGGQAMRDLSQTLRDQQGLADDAFRQLQDPSSGGQPGDQGQPGQPGPDGGSLAERQRDLRGRLDQLNGNTLPGPGSEPGKAGRQALDDAGRAMTEAERALRDGDLSGALDRQAEAMQALREGIRNLGEALADDQRRNGDATQGQAFGRNDPGSTRDPLGRELGDGARIGSDRNLLQGEDVYRRAQSLLDEIRRRSGEQSRPSGERDYLKRLLELF
ncbi:MAG: DUF4175 domain-containing protein [Pseudorhodobacter sp.]|nr:DUF4175 domain-containing protein [Pseudorhodobacter sp.]